MTAKKRPDQHTDTCPQCGGDGTIPGSRYTEPASVCPTCHGAGVVPAEADV